MKRSEDIQRTFALTGTRPFGYKELGRGSRDQRASSHWALLAHTSGQLSSDPALAPSQFAEYQSFMQPSYGTREMLS